MTRPAVFECGWDELRDLDLADWADDLVMAFKLGQTRPKAKAYTAYVEDFGELVVFAASKSEAADVLLVELDGALEPTPAKSTVLKWLAEVK